MGYTISIAVISALAGAALVWVAFYARKQKQHATAAPEQRRDGLHALIEATLGTTGDTFFYALVRELAQYLAVDAVFIAVNSDEKQKTGQTLAYWCDGGYIMNHEISLQHSPCGDSGSFWYMENSGSDLFPRASLLQQQFHVSGFFAAQLLDSSGQAIGILAGMNRADLHPQDNQVDVIKLFASRASSELERKLAIGETLMQKERAQITLHSIGDGVITTDENACIDYMNPAAEALTGWRFHQAMGMSMQAVLHLEDEISGNVISDPAWRCLEEKRIIAPRTDNVLISRSGERYSIQGTAAPMIDAQGKVTGVVLVFKDVTDSRRQQKMMVHQATHDPLTGLVNRVEFEQRLDKALQSARDFDNTHALLFLDLDQFKQVNDSAGHVAGDELLKQISALLAGQLRGRDTLGRMGGDEFCVLLENCPGSKASKVAEILIEVVREYRFNWDQKTYQVGVSIGVVPITAESASRSQLIIDADQACYMAKSLGRGRFYTHRKPDNESGSAAVEKIQPEDLRDALVQQRFMLLYQPIVSLQPENNAGQTRAEILLRLLDTDGSIITPGAFMPAASRFGLMPQIDRWVIDRLFNNYAHVFMQNPELVLGLNLSAASVADESLLEFLLQLFDKSVLQPRQVCFETSENALNNNLTAAGKLVEPLRALGCGFAIDNFGSGLASFAVLKKLPVDFIKINADLVRDIGSDQFDFAMVESINAMAHLLGIRTIAENVDNEAVIDQLKSIGVDFAQGYYLGDLAPLDEVGGESPGRETYRSQVN